MIIDTAIFYQQGNSEKFVGRALKDFAKCDEVFIATKFLPRSPAEVERNISGKKHVTEPLNQSLKKIANCYAYQLAKANALAEKNNFAKFISVQNHYNLLFREE